MNRKSFYELLNQLESDDKLTDSKRGQLTTEQDRQARLMAATRKFLLCMNSFSEQTYVC